MTACAPSRTAADTAQVMPRSLNEPVGFAPSSLSHTSAPTRSETRSASTSGVEPSSERDDRVVGLERQPVAEALDQADAADQTNSSSITRMARGEERMKSSWPISRTAA